MGSDVEQATWVPVFRDAYFIWEPIIVIYGILVHFCKILKCKPMPILQAQNSMHCSIRILAERVNEHTKSLQLAKVNECWQ